MNLVSYPFTIEQLDALARWQPAFNQSTLEAIGYNGGADSTFSLAHITKTFHLPNDDTPILLLPEVLQNRPIRLGLLKLFYVREIAFQFLQETIFEDVYVATLWCGCWKWRSIHDYADKWIDLWVFSFGEIDK